jgi:sec-independent protein translocase protein TatB
MFGIGFTELMLIAIVAILFLGPDKLPQTLVDIAKFFKSVKRTINDAKNSFEEEIRVADLKKEALEYKKKLEETTNELQGFKNFDMDELLESEKKATKKVAPPNNLEEISQDNTPKSKTPTKEEIPNNGEKA